MKIGQIVTNRLNSAIKGRVINITDDGTTWVMEINNKGNAIFFNSKKGTVDVYPIIPSDWKLVRSRATDRS